MSFVENGDGEVVVDSRDSQAPGGFPGNKIRFACADREAVQISQPNVKC